MGTIIEINTFVFKEMNSYLPLEVTCNLKQTQVDERYRFHYIDKLIKQRIQ